jgi:bacterioferritin
MGTVGQEIVGTHVGEIIDLLNRGIAAELNDAYRYLLLSKVAAGIHSGPAVEVFARTAADEWGHVGLLMDRVLQLGGQPMPGPAEATDRSYADYRPPPADPTDVKTMLADSLHGERAAIRFYRDLFDRTRDIDPVTAEIARQALIDEIDDEDDLERLLAGWPDR